MYILFVCYKNDYKNLPSSSIPDINDYYLKLQPVNRISMLFRNMVRSTELTVKRAESFSL